MDISIENILLISIKVSKTRRVINSKIILDTPGRQN